MPRSNYPGKEKTHYKTKYDGLVSAAEVLYGEFSPIEDHPLLEERDPETLLLEKTAFQDLSSESKTLIDIILSMPEEMFLLNGRIRKQHLTRITQEKTGWSRTKAQNVKDGLVKALLNPA